MSAKRGILLVIWLIGLALPLAGCFASTNINLPTVVPPLSPAASITASTSPTPFRPMTNTPTIIPPSLTPTDTFTPSPTSTPVPTDTPIPTPTPALVWTAPGDVITPILLYHHVSDAGNGIRYYVSNADFRAQMQALHDWGYNSITVSELVDVLIHGGELPNRPVVITFDDGNIDVYQNAFPMMHALGFVGTFYIVANRLQSKYFVNVEQLQEMAEAW